MSHYQNVPYEAPDNWDWCRIDDIAFVTKLAGFEYSKYIADNLSTTSGIPLFKGKNVKNGSVEYVFESYIPESISDELWRSQITKKCLLTPYVGAIGNVGIHSSEGKFHLGSNVGKIEISNDKENIYLEEFLRYYLMSSYGYAELTKHKKATAQESISIEAIRDVFIPVVSIEEQKRIVSEIEYWECLFDNIDQQMNNLHVLINRSKSKILELAMQGKLVPQDPADEPAADMLRRINPNAKIITDNPHSWNIPDTWCWSQLGDLFNHNTGKALNSSNTEGQEYEYITTSNVYWNRFELNSLKKMVYKESEIDKCKVERGDLLVCEGGDVGRAAIWNKEYPIMIQNHLHRLRPVSESILPSLYLLVFKLFKDKNLIGGKGIALQGFSSNALHKLVVPCIPTNEQKKIVVHIEELFAILDKIETSLQ